VSERLAIFAEGLFAAHNGKTAHGVIRYGTRDVVAVIDSTCAVFPVCFANRPSAKMATRSLTRASLPGRARGSAVRGRPRSEAP